MCPIVLLVRVFTARGMVAASRPVLGEGDQQEAVARALARGGFRFAGARRGELSLGEEEPPIAGGIRDAAFHTTGLHELKFVDRVPVLAAEKYLRAAAIAEFACPRMDVTLRAVAVVAVAVDIILHKAHCTRVELWTRICIYCQCVRFE